MPKPRSLTKNDLPSLAEDVRRRAFADASHILSGSDDNMSELIQPGHEYRVALVEQHIPACLGPLRWPLARSIALRNAHGDAAYLQERDKNLIAFLARCEATAKQARPPINNIIKHVKKQYRLFYTAQEAADILQCKYKHSSERSIKGILLHRKSEKNSGSAKASIGI